MEPVVQPLNSKSRSLSIVGEDALYGYLQQAIADAGEHGTSLSLLLLDLTGLHIVSDARHRTGDQMVLEIARLLQNDVGSNGLLGRMAGSELVAVLKGRSRSDATFIGKRVQAQLGRLELELKHDEYARVSLSFGVAEFGVNGEEVDDLLRVATMETHRNTAPPGSAEGVWQS